MVRVVILEEDDKLNNSQYDQRNFRWMVVANKPLSEN